MNQRVTPARTPGATRPGSVLAAWALAVGIDLFFNAGVLSPLFDQEREPNLLSDAALFRRIPVAYIGLLVAVAALAWVIDRLDVDDGRMGFVIGAGVGVVISAMGVVSLWTAIDMTLAFVAAAVLVQISQMAGAGAALGAISGAGQSSRAIRFTIVLSLTASILAIVVQNLI